MAHLTLVKLVAVSFRIDPKELEILELVRDKTGLTMSELMRFIVKESINSDAINLVTENEKK